MCAQSQIVGNFLMWREVETLVPPYICTKVSFCGTEVFTIEARICGIYHLRIGLFSRKLKEAALISIGRHAT